MSGSQRKPETGLSVILFGGSGAVGTRIISELVKCPHVAQVTLIVRGLVQIFHNENSSDHHYSKFCQELVDFEDMHSFRPILQKKYDIAFYAIGLKASSPNFQVHELNYATQLMGLLNHVPQFHYISSMHASPTSWFPLFRVKGEIEDIAKSVGFQRLCIYRIGGVLTKDGAGMGPSLQFIGRFFDPFRWIHIEGEDLARAVVNNSLKHREIWNGVEIYEHSALKTLL